MNRLQWIVLASRFMLELANFGINSLTGSTGDRVGKMDTGTLKSRQWNRPRLNRWLDPVLGVRLMEVQPPPSSPILSDQMLITALT